jgi:hypothetical protein
MVEKMGTARESNVKGKEGGGRRKERSRAIIRKK